MTGKGTADMGGCALALMMAEDGLALFSIEGDIPIACLAEAECDLTDWEGAAGVIAEAVHAQGLISQPCEIWLDESQMIRRKSRLEGADESDIRHAAASALSASTAFRAEMLAFDVGQRDAEGYTPIAAISHERLREAEALARRTNLDPVRVTTSDDMDGFARRPGFRVQSRAVAMARPAAVAAALTAALVLPVLAYLGANSDRGLSFASKPLLAAVVSFEDPAVKETHAALMKPEASARDGVERAPEETANRLWLEIAPARVPDPALDLNGLLPPSQRVAPVRPDEVSFLPDSLPVVARAHVRAAPGEGDPKLGMMKGIGTPHVPYRLGAILPAAADVLKRKQVLDAVLSPPALGNLPLGLGADHPRSAALEFGTIHFTHAGPEATGPPRVHPPGPPVAWFGSIRVANVGEGAPVGRPVTRPSFDSGQGLGAAQNAAPASTGAASNRSVRRPPWRLGDERPQPPFLPARAFNYTRYDRLLQRPAAPDLTPQPPGRLPAPGARMRPPQGMVGPGLPRGHGQDLVGFKERREAAIVRAVREAGGEGSFSFRALPRRLAPLSQSDAGARVLIRAPESPRRVSGEPGPEPLVTVFSKPRSAQGPWRGRRISLSPLDKVPVSARFASLSIQNMERPVPPPRETATNRATDLAADPAADLNTGPDTSAAQEPTIAAAPSEPVPQALASIARRQPPDRPRRQPILRRAPVDRTLALARMDARNVALAAATEVVPNAQALSEPLPDVVRDAVAEVMAAPEPAPQDSTIAEAGAQVALLRPTAPARPSVAPLSRRLPPGRVEAPAQSPAQEAFFGPELPPGAALETAPALSDAAQVAALLRPSPPSRAVGTPSALLRPQPPQRQQPSSAGAPSPAAGPEGQGAAETAGLARVAPPARVLPEQRSAALARLLPPMRPEGEPPAKTAPQASADEGAGGVAYLAPLARPRGLSARASEIRAARAAAKEKVAARQQPARTTPQNQLSIPGNARVGTTATIKDGIELGDIALIGIFGKKNKRRALIRLPQGKIVQVERGTRVSGWTVSAISDDGVRIQKGARNQTLRLPN